MPIARTFSEELSHEWLGIRGYMVDPNVPLVGAQGTTGGRNEADAVGVKSDGTHLDILHVEIGSWPGYDNVKWKFTPAITALVEKYVRNKVGFTGPIQYHKLYIAIYLPQNFDKAKVETGIQVWSFHEFIHNELKSAIKEWRDRTTPPSCNEPELPESMWLLKLFDFLDIVPEEKLVNVPLSSF